MYLFISNLLREIEHKNKEHEANSPKGIEEIANPTGHQVGNLICILLNFCFKKNSQL